MLSLTVNAATVRYTSPDQTTNIVNTVVTNVVLQAVNNGVFTNLSFSSTDNLQPIIRMTNIADTIYGPFILYYKVRGTQNSLSNVAVGDIISRMQYLGYFSNAFDSIASVYTTVVATNNILNNLAGTYYITTQDTNNTVHTYSFDNKGYINPAVGIKFPNATMQTTAGLPLTGGTLSGVLTILSSHNTGHLLQILTPGTNSNALITFTNGTRVWEMGICGTNDTFQLADMTAGTVRISVDNTGSVALSSLMFPDASIQTNAFTGGITTNITLYTHASDGTTPITNNIYITNGTIKNWTY